MLIPFVSIYDVFSFGIPFLYIDLNAELCYWKRGFIVPCLSVEFHSYILAENLAPWFHILKMHWETFIQLKKHQVFKSYCYLKKLLVFTKLGWSTRFWRENFGKFIRYLALPMLLAQQYASAWKCSKTIQIFMKIKYLKKWSYLKKILLPKSVRKLETGRVERYIVMKLGASVCTNIA